jgi:photosystem II stability/assembly factor-like uncharacterized protein
MRRFHRIVPSLVVAIFLFCHPTSFSQECTVYATVHSTKAFVVGGNNPQTGLFYQKSSNDTVWMHTGSSNIHGFAVAAAHRMNGQVLYMGAGNGVHLTTDAGNSWKITTGWEMTEILSVVVDDHDWRRVFCSSPYGIYRTEDGGIHWKQCFGGLTTRFVSSLIIDHANPAVLYCSTEDGVFSTSNGADTWRKTSLAVKGIRCIAQHPSDPRVLAIGTEDDGVYLSHNGGKSWERSAKGIEHPTFYKVVFDAKNPLTMYAAGFQTGVYKSTDGGRSWQHSQRGLVSLNIHSIAVDPLRPDRVYAGTFGRGVYRSEDGGITWNYAGLEGSTVWSIIIQPS